MTVAVTARNDPAYVMQIASAVQELQKRQVAVISPIVADYVANTQNELILADATAGAISVSLPPVKKFYGKSLQVKKLDASGNSVTLQPQAGELIDGAASKAISTQWMSYIVVSTGLAWVIV